MQRFPRNRQNKMRKLKKVEQKNKNDTLCENCGKSFPLTDATSCSICGVDPLCPNCVCEECPPGDRDE